VKDYTASQKQALIERIQELIPAVVEDLWVHLQRQEGAPGLTEIERTVRRALRPVGQELILEVVHHLSRGQTADPPTCSCGQPTTFEHFAPLTLLTTWGEMTLSRPYFSCATCHHGVVPLDEMLKIGPGGLSPALEESLSLMGGCMPFRLAVRTIKNLLGVELPAKTGQRVTDRVGAELEAQQQAAIQRAWTTDEFPPSEGPAPETLYVSTDGTLVRLGAQFHEVKVAAFYRAEERHTRDGGTELHAVDTTYVAAVQEPAEEFAKRVLIEGYRRGWQRARKVVVLGDGAAWNWTHIAAQVPPEVPEIVEIVDFYHASEHLWAAAKAVLGEGTTAAKMWVETQEGELLQGGVERVIRAVADWWVQTGAEREQLVSLGEEKAQDLPEPRKTIRQTWTFLTNNRERMRYDDYRRQGLFIGSGTVESACNRLIGARLKQSGMRWSQMGAQQVVQVRAAVLSDRDRWESFWDHRCPPRRNHSCRERVD
jgi:hypothetical protein